MRRALRIFATAAGLCALALWGLSFQYGGIVPFNFRGEARRVIVHAGRLTFDNAPAVDADRHASAFAWAAQLSPLVKPYLKARERADKALAWCRAGDEALRPGYTEAEYRRAFADREARSADYHRVLAEIKPTEDAYWSVANAQPAPPRRLWSLTIPPYVPPACAALPAVPAAFRVLKRRRRRARLARVGLCAACGYDLRATPDRCPECGRPTVGR